MTIKPIPAELLGDSFTLITPSPRGDIRTVIDNVRIDKQGKTTDYYTERRRDLTELTIIFDCENSSPSGTVFSVGQTAEYDEELFELTDVKLYSSDCPHHYTLKARKIDG